jgi:biotin carboxyl carrier protein
VKYIVDVGGRRVEVERTGETVSVDGGPAVRAQLTTIEGSAMLLLRIGDAPHQVHRVTARRAEGRGAYTLDIEGRRFTVEALDERTRAIQDLTASREGPSGPRPLVAPMPGLIVKVHVSPGDRVEAGQGAVAMEAMKMENELRVPAAGTVKAVHAKVGEAVEKGMVLVEFE